MVVSFAGSCGRCETSAPQCWQACAAMSRLDVGFDADADARQRAICACHRSWPTPAPKALPLLGGVLELSASWRQAQFRFKFGDRAPTASRTAWSTRLSFPLRQDQTVSCFLVERIKTLRESSKLESAPDSPVKFPNNLAKIAVKKQV